MLVVSDETAIAYLEDQSTRRTSGYRVGDATGDGRVARIAADHVVLAATHQMIRVVLRDHRKIRTVNRDARRAHPHGAFAGPTPPDLRVATVEDGDANARVTVCALRSARVDSARRRVRPAA